MTIVLQYGEEHLNIILTEFIGYKKELLKSL